MSEPTVSVIMAAYNHAPFVAQAIQSVLSQRGVDFEFLIADDGSVDGTRAAIETIHDDRIQFVPNPVNRGAAIVTNELIGRARGEFVALINSDDYWSHDEKLAEQVATLSENPAIAACFGRARFVDGRGRAIDSASLTFGTVFDQENRSRGRWLRRFFDEGNCICHPTMLIRRSCYSEIGLYSAKLRQLPDFDMWVRLVKHRPIYVADRIWIDYRIRPGKNASSQTAENSIRTINEHYLIAANFFDGVNRDVLIEGFGDVLVCPDIPSEEHLEIEKALLYLRENTQGLANPYKLLGLLKVGGLLDDSAHRDILCESYGIDDRWFHTRTAEIDVLRPRTMALADALYHSAWNTWLPRLMRTVRTRP
jgi:glycosyltransferase involved in cell wall biosynthesis